MMTTFIKRTFFGTVFFASAFLVTACGGKQSSVPASPESDSSAKTAQPSKTPQVLFKTSLGDMLIELYPEKAPISVSNFMAYVESGFYDDTIFHRVIPGFVVQGGGFGTDLKRRATNAPIQNESNNGLKNTVATLSMARTMDPHSATSQFFINLVDNTSLDNQPGQPGYAVFGKVIEGFGVAQTIASLPRGKNRQFPEAPNDTVVIEDAEVVNQ